MVRPLRHRLTRGNRCAGQINGQWGDSHVECYVRLSHALPPAAVMAHEMPPNFMVMPKPRLQHCRRAHDLPPRSPA